MSILFLDIKLFINQIRILISKSKSTIWPASFIPLVRIQLQGVGLDPTSEVRDSGGGL